MYDADQIFHMRLQQINEGVEQKVADKAREALRGAMGQIVADPDALFDHLVKGVAGVNHLILDDTNWWEQLTELMAPIDPQIIQQAYDATAQHIMGLMQKGPLTAAILEGFGSGFIAILKKLAAFIIKAAIAGLALVGNSSGSRLQGNQPQAKAALAKQKEQIGLANIATIVYFLEQVLPAAAETANSIVPANNTNNVGGTPA